MNPLPKQSELAISLKAAATMTSLSRRTLENYIRAKRLRARKIGRRTVILIRDLEAFLRTDQSSPVREPGLSVDAR